MSLFKFPVTSRHSLQLQVKLEYYNLLPITNALQLGRTTLPMLHRFLPPPPLPRPWPHLLRIKVYLLKYIEHCPPHPLPNKYCPHCITRRMFVIETASRACKITQFLSKGQRSEKLTTHFCLRAFRLKT